MPGEFMTIGDRSGGSGGRARTVLVLRNGDGEKALITTIVCRTVPAETGLIFHGPGRFVEKTRDHISETAYPTVCTILERLGLTCPGFMISAVNLGAASWDHRDLSISGYSADVPVFLAMLTAGLNIMISDEILSTGHLASRDGDVRVVGSLPAKMAAAESDESIKKFLYPDLRNDGSLNPLLNEEEINEIQTAIAKAKRSLQVVPFRDVADLLRAILPDDQLILAGLRNGYFGHGPSRMGEDGPVARAVEFLRSDLENKFWSVLERSLIGGQSDKAHPIIKTFVDFHLERNSYPARFGSKFLQLLISLSPHTRRLQLHSPLLPMADCIRLAQYASEEEHADVKALFKAINGEVARGAHNPSGSKSPRPGDNEDQKLTAVLSLINSESLTARINLPIDSARAAFPLDSVIAESHEVFNETVTSFFCHLIRRVRGMGEPAYLEASGGEAFALLERTYTRKGGLKGALAEARAGFQGGLRSVLDAMTEQFKKEAQESEVNRVLKEALDPLDWEAQVSFVTALVNRLKTHLPSEITDKPAERYANHVETLARAYVESMDRLNSVFRLL